MQHVTIGIVPSFDTDPTYMQNAEHIQVLYVLGQGGDHRQQLHIQDGDR